MLLQSCEPGIESRTETRTRVYSRWVHGLLLHMASCCTHDTHNFELLDIDYATPHPSPHLSKFLLVYPVSLMPSRLKCLFWRFRSLLALAALSYRLQFVQARSIGRYGAGPLSGGAVGRGRAFAVFACSPVQQGSEVSASRWRCRPYTKFCSICAHSCLYDDVYMSP